MNCPECKNVGTKVIDSRSTTDNRVVRRRECIKCKKRFTTYERYATQAEESGIIVTKEQKDKLYKAAKIITAVLKHAV